MEYLEKLYQHFLQASGVCTDTRQLKQGELFFALRGPNFNGNKYAAQALEKGASLAVIDDAEFAELPRTLLVENVLEALQALATHHRKQQKIPFIGLTGSNGKTTSKELLAAVLRKKYEVHATEGNLNNHIGVPLTILRMPQNTEIAVIEMGANKEGDIAELCEIARPTHGFITNIGKAHLEGFGGIEGVLRGKTELFQFLRANDGFVFLNEADKRLAPMRSRFSKLKTYGTPDSDFFTPLLQTQPTLSFKAPNGEVKTQLVGDYNFSNILVSLCLGEYFQVPMESACKAVSEYIPDNQRSQVILRGAHKIILDAYNANPDSMKAALRSFHETEGTHKIVVLGDMLELGAQTLNLHREIILLAQQSKIDDLILVGPLFQKANTQVSMNQAQAFATREAAAKWLSSHMPESTTVLIKGSRGIALEKILDEIPQLKS